MTDLKTIAKNIAANIPDATKRIVVEHSLSDSATCYDQVLAFHSLYDCPIATTAYEGIPQMSDERLAMRVDLIDEEFTELQEAITARDIIEIGDACGDLVYVICGLAIEAGIDLEAVLAEIHASNMTKLDSDGTVIRRDDGKILKGPNFRKPDLRAVIDPVKK